MGSQTMHKGLPLADLLFKLILRKEDIALRLPTARQSTQKRYARLYSNTCRTGCHLVLRGGGMHNHLVCALPNRQRTIGNSGKSIIGIGDRHLSKARCLRRSVCFSEMDSTSEVESISIHFYVSRLTSHVCHLTATVYNLCESTCCAGLKSP